MTTRELIKELENQKAMLGSNVFNPELLEKYLNLSVAKESKINFSIHGIRSIENINDKLNRIYPYKTSKPRFNRAKGEWYILFAIARKTDLPVNISVSEKTDKKHSYQKTPMFLHKQDIKAA